MGGRCKEAARKQQKLLCCAYFIDTGGIAVPKKKKKKETFMHMPVRKQVFFPLSIWIAAKLSPATGVLECIFLLETEQHWLHP